MFDCFENEKNLDKEEEKKSYFKLYDLERTVVNVLVVSMLYVCVGIKVGSLVYVFRRRRVCFTRGYDYLMEFIWVFLKNSFGVLWIRVSGVRRSDWEYLYFGLGNVA